MSRHLSVCIPTLDQTDWWFAHDLALAVGYHAKHFPQDVVDLNANQGAIIQESRNVLARQAIENGAEWLIWLDTDMRFPQNLFDRLMEWDKPFVAANCAKRRRPIAPTARVIDGEDITDDQPVWPDPDRHDLQEIDVVGLAVACVKSEVFLQIEYPWFDVKYIAERDWYAGEDIVFCGKLNQAGIPRYIDHGLSWGVRHIGQYQYGMNDVLGEKAFAEQTGYWADRIKTGNVAQAVSVEAGD